jgi:hypothetical protein
MNDFCHAPVEWFVERTHSINRSRARVRPYAASQLTITDMLRPLVSGLHLVDGERWAATIRGRDARSFGAVLLPSSGALQGPRPMRIVALSNSDRRVSGGRPSQPVVGRPGIARHDALRSRHPCCPFASAASLVISSIEAPAVPPQHERHHVPRAGLLVPLPVHPHRGATFGLLTV